MAMYYEVELQVAGRDVLYRLDTNVIPLKDWKHAVDFAMTVGQLGYDSEDVQFTSIKEYKIINEPKKLGYIFQPQMPYGEEYIQ